MQYRGHVENGVILLDEQITLPEGTKVTGETFAEVGRKRAKYPLRGTPYRFEKPFEPVVPEQDWEALR